MTRREMRQIRSHPPRNRSLAKDSRRNDEIVQYNPKYHDEEDEYYYDEVFEGDEYYDHLGRERSTRMEDRPSREGRVLEANLRRIVSRREDRKEEPARESYSQSRVYMRPTTLLEIHRDNSMTSEEIYLAQKALGVEKNRLNKMVIARRVVTFDESLEQRPNPLCGKIQVDKIDSNKKVPNLPRYNGNSCLTEHVLHYEGPMEAQVHNQNVKAIMFQTTSYNMTM